MVTRKKEEGRKGRSDARNRSKREKLTESFPTCKGRFTTCTSCSSQWATVARRAQLTPSENTPCHPGNCAGSGAPPRCHFLWWLVLCSCSCRQWEREQAELDTVSPGGSIKDLIVDQMTSDL
ncbi:hypothetical protein INR49_006597 [Caranx melampygus]|nr:hypothetical protein INR49_006597 [Caranx melampygus]